MALVLRFAEEAEFSSRAVEASYDEEEEHLQSEPSCIFRWSKATRNRLAETAGVLVAQRLVVAVRGSPQLFLQHLTSSWNLIGSIVATDESAQSVTLDARIRLAAGQILSREAPDAADFGANIAVIVPNDISNDAIWSWIQALQLHVNTAETIVFDSQISPIYDFGYGSDDAPMLRSLTSTAARDAKFDRLVPTLETPRFVTGVTAALLTQGELRCSRVRVFISLRSAQSSTAESARSFSPLISLLDLPSPAVPFKSTLPVEDDGDADSFNTLYT